MTEDSKCRFTVKESKFRQTYLFVEPSDEALSATIGGELSFHFSSSKTIEEAEEIAKYLNSKIESISFTPAGPVLTVK